jgi:hypothetical protein
MIEREMKVTIHQHRAGEGRLTQCAGPRTDLDIFHCLRDQLQTHISLGNVADLAKGIEALEVAHEAIATHLVCFADCVNETRKQECNVHSRSRRDVHLAESNHTPFFPSPLDRCSVAPLHTSRSKSRYASGEANEGST